jgi:hypothetical protein
MENELIPYEVRNASPLVFQTLPRLVATFGEQHEKILACVAEIDVHATELITTHYSSLNFSSKPDDYWDKVFKSDYLSWGVMIGIREVPDQIAILDVLDTLKSTFGIHNEQSIKEAIKMNLRGLFPNGAISHFGRLDRVYLTAVMNEYEKLLKKAHKQAIEARDKFKEEISETEKWEMACKSVKQTFNDFAIKENWEQQISYAHYNVLEKSGIKVCEDAAKSGYMNEAKDYINNNSLSTMNSVEKEVINVAKRMAVRDLFRKLVKENKNLNIC